MEDGGGHIPPTLLDEEQKENNCRRLSSRAGGSGLMWVKPRRPLWRKSIIDPAASRPVTEQRHIRRLMLFFAIVYAVEGIGQGRFGIIFQPLSYYLKVNGWSPVEVTAYFAVLNFPWVIKPAFGLVSDFVPLFGYRRKSYLLISSALSAASYGGIAILTEPRDFALLLLFTSYAM